MIVFLVKGRISDNTISNNVIVLYRFNRW